jgi:Type I phosphodiesterase / nucleotide pyrophosphatase
VVAGFARAQVGVRPSRPKLVLVLSIDQMRFDYLTRFGPLFKGGLRRLLDHGAVFTHAMYAHADTETGPGHSVILSGRHPSHSGIVANDWYDPLAKKRINVVDDPVQAPLGGPGRAASPVNFLGFTVGDVLKRDVAGARVVGVSLKDRSAILLSGRRADAAYWYETVGGNFITSTYYMKEAPAWLTKRNAQHPADRYFGKPWTRLNADEKLYEKYAGPDAIEGEWDRKDTVFPHVIRGKPGQVLYYDDLRRTPFADELTLEVALEAMAAHDLGRDEATDLFAVGFSATDVIGHTYGPQSQEIMDQLLRLDGVLGRLLDEVDQRVGPGRTLVVLSADHGVMPLVELLQAHGIAAQRVKPSALELPVVTALRARFPDAGPLIANYDPPDFYLDLDAIRSHGLRRQDVESTMEKALMDTGLVEVVYTHAKLMGEPPADDPPFTLFRNAFYEPRSPHVIPRLKEYLYLSERVGGAGHGTYHDYDRAVPIVFMGTRVKPGSYPAPCGPEDIAPTLGLLLGLEYPLQDADRLLSEMIEG